MALIAFTDADGTWKLHNAMPHPASRFRGWTPDSAPFGDSAARQSDGTVSMFRLRTDYAVSLSLSGIPLRRSSNVCLRSEDLANWTPVGTPTLSTAHTSTGISLDLLGDDSAVALEAVQRSVAFTGNGTKPISVYVRAGSSGFSAIQVSDASAGQVRLFALVTWSNSVPSVNATTGTYQGYEIHGNGVFRLLLTTTAVTAANTNNIILYPACDAAADVSLTGTLYIGGIQAEDGTTHTPYINTTTAARSGVSMVEVADRLIYHLRNGGNCTVYPNDVVGTAYTCGLKPGTVPTLDFSDRRALEYTLNAQLLNLNSPASRMLAYYAD